MAGISGEREGGGVEAGERDVWCWLSFRALSSISEIKMSLPLQSIT